MLLFLLPPWENFSYREDVSDDGGDDFNAQSS